MSPAQQARLMTADEFWGWCGRPENVGKRAELVHGKVVEMPSPGEVHGSLCWWIGVLLGLYVLKRGRGRATSNDTGLLVEDSPQRVVLKVQGGKLETVAREDVDAMKVSELSLMPEGLEKQLKPQEIADLFAFITLDKHPDDRTARPIPSGATGKK